MIHATAFSRASAMAALFAYAGSVLAQTPLAIEWQKTLGGTYIDVVFDMCTTPDGGYVLACQTSSNDGDVSGNHGEPQFSADMWVVRLSSAGELLWQRCYGGTDTERATSVKATPDGGFILAGYTQSNNGDVSGNHGLKDIWVLKITGAGDPVWQRCLGGSDNDEAGEVLVAPDGGYLVVGGVFSDDGDVVGSHGGGELWVVKLDEDGGLAWQRCYGGSATESGSSAVVNSAGNFVLAGQATSTDGDVGSNNGNWDFWVLEIDTDGTLLWEENYGGTLSDLVHGGVTPCADGGYAVIGSSASMDGDVSGHWGTTSEDIWLIKISAAGVLEWDRFLGSTAGDRGFSVAQLADGSFITAGDATGWGGNITNPVAMNFEGDYWLVHLDAQGQTIWDLSLGGTEWENAACMVLTPEEDIVVSGTSGSIDGDVEDGGNWEIWTVKLTPHFNTVMGSVFTDLDSDGQGSGPNEIPLAFAPVYFQDEDAFTIADTAGHYELHALDTGTVLVHTPPVPYFSIAPPEHAVHFLSMDSVVSGRDFAYQPLAETTDIASAIGPVTPFRPGFTGAYHVICGNLGNTPQAPLLTLQADPLLQLVYSTRPPTTWDDITATWQLPVIAPLDYIDFTVGVYVSAQAPLGQWLFTHVGHTPIPGDVIPLNDSLTAMVSVQGSYDPNDITVDRSTLSPTEVQGGTTALEYLVRFQNTGTDTAFTVQVQNPLPELADKYTFQFLGASHPLTIDVEHNDELWFRFANILLPDSGTNEALSHGFIRYRLHPRTDLVLGDSIRNTASIFFDYNAPVITNTAVTVVDEAMALPAPTAAQPLLLVPNPMTDEVALLSDEVLTAAHVVEWCDAAGRVVQRQAGAGSTTLHMRIGHLLPGVYTLRITAPDGRRKALRAVVR